MKKVLFVIILSILTLTFLFTACSSDFGGYKNLGDYYAPTVGDNSLNAEGGEVSGEDYTEIKENDFVDTSVTTESYFSIDANTASYPNVRRMINTGIEQIPKDAVRVEEILNYFTYDYSTPTNGEVFALTSSIFPNPYNSETKLMCIGLATEKVEMTEQQNNIVFLIDTSGSMFDELPLVQIGFKLLAENLNPTDRVSVVTYAGSSEVALDGAYGYETDKIKAVIEDLSAGGSTAGCKGLQTAYEIAGKHYIEGGNNRVILMTDGDFNVGISSNIGLENFISEKRESGIFLSTFGVGSGNYQSSKMETLALKGNGTYSYIDSVAEARKALVEQIGGTLITVAKDVKAGVYFNPDYVSSFRLIGYENKLLTQEEFENNATDAGELGSGHTATVVYEIKLTEAGENLTEGNFAEVKIRYKKPSEGTDAVSSEQVLPITASSYHNQLTFIDNFVSSVIEFALVLRQSDFVAQGNIENVIARLNQLNLDDDEEKLEFRNLVKYYQDRYDHPLEN